VRLAAGRTAVVLGPASVLTGGLTDNRLAERARADLIKSDMIEAIIRLPGGLVPFRPGYQPALWEMTPAFGSRWAGRILLADVSDRRLTDDVVDALVEDVMTWRREGYEPRAHDRQFSSQQLVRDLIEPPGPLIPRRARSAHAATAAAHADVARIADLQADLSTADCGIAVGPMSAPERKTIGALAAGKHLVLIKGTRLRDDDVSADGHHVVIRPEEVLGQRRLGELTIDRATLASRYPQARLTEPGDVIVTTAPALGAIVDEAGFCVASFPARAVRIAEAGRGLLTPRVLAAMIVGGHERSRPPGAIRLAHRLEEMQVPLLGPDELARLDALLAALDQRRRRAQREIGLLAELRQITAAGLADGTLTCTIDLD
jgi:hypothetical protein